MSGNEEALQHVERRWTAAQVQRAELWMLIYSSAAIILLVLVGGLIGLVCALAYPPNHKWLDSTEAMFTSLTAHYVEARQTDRLPVFTVYSNTNYVNFGKLCVSVESMRVELCRMIATGPVIIEMTDAREDARDGGTLAVAMFYSDRANCGDDISRVCPPSIADTITEEYIRRNHLAMLQNIEQT